MRRRDPIGDALNGVHPPPQRDDFFAELRRRASEEQSALARGGRTTTRALAVAAAVLLVTVALLLAFGSPFVHAADGGDAFASGGLVKTIQDTTVSCASRQIGPVHAFDVFLLPKQPSIPAVAGVAAGPYSMVGIESVAVGVGFLPGLPISARGVGVNRKHCRRTNVHVPLARAGIPGPPVHYGALAHCILEGRVLIRARAVWDGHGFSAQLAVRLANGTAIGYIRLSRDGTGALYSSTRCEIQS